jgi:hypothetical protein
MKILRCGEHCPLCRRLYDIERKDDEDNNKIENQCESGH